MAYVPQEKIFKIPCISPVPVLRPEKVSVLGSKRREGGKILSCPTKARTISTLFLVQKLSFGFLWPTVHSCLLLLVSRPAKDSSWIPQINLVRVPGCICLCRALANFMVALGMGKIVRSYFSFPFLTLPLFTQYLHMCLSRLELGR